MHTINNSLKLTAKEKWMGVLRKEEDVFAPEDIHMWEQAAVSHNHICTSHV